MLDFRPLFLTTELEVIAAFDVSGWRSTGEPVGPVSEFGALGYTSWRFGCRRGDVKGLKYSPGTVYSGILKAGDASGVQEACPRS
jgi:hypothetical protein